MAVIMVMVMVMAVSVLAVSVPGSCARAMGNDQTSSSAALAGWSVAELQARQAPDQAAWQPGLHAARHPHALTCSADRLL